MHQPSTVPQDRYCDVVMTGGITSGVVYPKALHELAQHYILKNIGGTSAGAIAAAVAAAAEFQRRNRGSMAGFERLAQLPAELGGKMPGRWRTFAIKVCGWLKLKKLAASLSQKADSKLLTLFQPQDATRRLFGVLVTSLNRTSTWGRTAAIVWGFIKAYWPAVALSAALACLIAREAGLIAGGLSFVAALVGLIGLWVYVDITSNLVGNDYGLCRGTTLGKNHPQELTDWLHALIQEAAGRTADDPPLTFGELWDAPGFPPPWLKLPQDVQIKSINLEMFTTNLSHGRPYILPHDDDFSQLFYNADELKHFLPEKVTQWLNQHATPYAPRPGRENRDPSVAEGTRLCLHKLPRAQAFPVLLATRMSLSFPLLFSAIPLWAIDHDPDPDKQSRSFARCRFSDGGICSNFPMHLFDGLIPLWPTFGISLEPKLPARPEMVYLPQQYQEGYGERWARFDHPSAKAATRFGGFVAAIVNVMQNWNDIALSRMPGVRDRVVRVRLNADEGGLNLNMSDKNIQNVSERGQEAAQTLLKRFLPQQNSASASGWDEQRWLRFNVLLCMLQERLPGVACALTPGTAHTSDFSQMIARALQAAPAGKQQALSPAEAAALNELYQVLLNFAAQMNQVKGYAFEAIPEPELRVRPPL